MAYTGGGGTWEATSLPIRPGLYINFVDKAIESIRGGARGVVSMILTDYNGEAGDEKVYTVESVTEAQDLFGEDNINPIRLALSGGAQKVIVFTKDTEGAEAMNLDDVLDELETYVFNVFVYPGLTEESDKTTIKDWVADKREEGKHFMAVFGGDIDADADPDTGNTRSGTLEDEYVVNLITGGTLAEEEYNSAEYAPYIAGLIAGTPINQSITYKRVSLNDVNKRLKHSQIEDALEAGSLVLVHDGEKVKVEQGVTTDGSKIRLVRAKQAVATDIPATASEHYIGRLDNNEDGRIALMNAISAYLERFENNNILIDPVVEVDPENPPTGDKVFLLISYTEVDSMERIFLKIKV